MHKPKIYEKYHIKKLKSKKLCINFNKNLPERKRTPLNFTFKTIFRINKNSSHPKTKKTIPSASTPASIKRKLAQNTHNCTQQHPKRQKWTKRNQPKYYIEIHIKNHNSKYFVSNFMKTC